MTANPTPARVAVEIRRLLRRDGSAEHAKGVQWFFKEEIRSYGWHTGDLRRLAATHRRSIQKEIGIEGLVRVSNELFAGRVLEEKVFAVLLLEKLISSFDDSHLALFETWLNRITSWADHDALVHYLIAQMIASEPARAQKVFQWARSRDRWHRRAACVALIQGTRQKKFFSQITRLSGLLLKDEDDMVQKGLGWLLRETAKADPKRTIPYLLKIRNRAPRLVLRTACETLSRPERNRILLKQVQ
jgi:3-methyladenine DNA glycosylase AlkD